ncbi:MAG TPA: hypothetical protein VKY74_01465 [Chloroflexia bacterium]|nr:hypothetical protein [Chloroflexia bacterium]
MNSTAAAHPQSVGGLWVTEVETPTTAARAAAALVRAGNRIGAIYLWQGHTGVSFRAARTVVAELERSRSTWPRPRV